MPTPIMAKRSMIKIWICLTLTAMALATTAQNQQGLVKTIGKPGRKGVPLSGVTVQVKGGHNAVLSNNRGKFSIPMAGKKNGDAYSLLRVQKNGYELNEKDIIGRKYAFSSSVPMTIVMVSTAQLQADKQRIEDNAYKTAERNYSTKISKLEKQLNDNAISAEQYRTALLELQDKFEKYQSLIDELAEHYAHTDYDVLNEKERQVNILIENGELEKADSLISTMFDPIDVLQRNKAALERIDKSIAEAQGAISQANADLAAVIKQQEKDAEYLYQLYTIALGQFDNERAFHYLQTRAELDTTNHSWQKDAGDFSSDYLGNYKLALMYYNRALEQVRQQYGEENESAGVLYGSIGLAQYRLGQYDEALENFSRALSIHGDDNPEATIVYSGIGGIYLDKKDFDHALEYFQKGLQIAEKNNPESDIAASAYNNIGIAYNGKGDAKTALEYHNKALAINERIYGDEHPIVAMNYNQIAADYNIAKDYEKSLKYNLKAAAIREKVLGKNHPATATSYNNLGVNYGLLNDNNKSLEYYLKAADVIERVFGKEHASTASVYDNLSTVYQKLGDLRKSLDYSAKCENIYSKLLPASHPYMALLYTKQALMFSALNDYAHALDRYTKAYEIKKKQLGESNKEVIEYQQVITKTKHKLALAEKDMAIFLADHCFEVTVVGNDSPASKLGMSGNYVLLQYCDWKEDDPISLFDKAKEYQGKPKDLVVLKDGKISRYHFEDKMGLDMHMKQITTEEREQINQLYRKWKKKNKK